MDTLFATFPKTSAEAWKEKLQQDLKGRSFQDLITTDNNGISILPFYTPDNRPDKSQLLFRQADWEICVSIPVQDPQANEKALAALNGGATGLLFDIHDQEGADWAALLDQVSIGHIFTGYQFRHPPTAKLASLTGYLKDHSSDFSGNCFLGYDPIASYFTGQSTDPLDTGAYHTFRKEAGNYFGLIVDTTIYQNSGANSVTQLALCLAHLNEYLYWLEQNDTLPTIKRIFIKTAAGTAFFEEIAKLRALRQVLPTLLNSYGVAAEIFLMAENSDLYRTPTDIYNNILRDSLSGMASVLGGCNTLLMHDYNALDPDADHRFSGRLARNQQLIFKEESYFNKVADVASGSFYLEKLSREMAEKTWQLFQEIMAAESILNYFQTGALRRLIQQQATDLIDEYHNGNRALIGVNKFINPDPKTNIDEPIIPPAPDENTPYLQPVNIATRLLRDQETDR